MKRPSLNKCCVCAIIVFLSAWEVVAANKEFDDGTPGRMTWGVGDHYKLATDADGWSIIEPGQQHRKIYVAADGTSSNSGLSPDSPVDLTTGQSMIRGGSSDWLLIRRGDIFDGGIRFGANMLGESPLHPIVIGAYGQGPRPILRGKCGAIKNYPRVNIVIRDLHKKEHGFSLNPAGPFENLLIENVLMDNASSALIGTCKHITIRRCVIKNCHKESPPNPKHKPDDGWARDPLRNRHQGLFANGVRGLLIEECTLDHNGWEEGYLEEGGGPDDPQPPSMYSHNLYLSTKNRDLTVRSNINARAASQALRDGSGQFCVGNVMIANNIGGYSGPDGGDGNYTTFADNVLIHPAGKRAPKIGGRGWGWSMKDVQGSQAIRNIFAHAIEGQNDEGLKMTEGVLVEDYVRYNWHEQADLNPTGRAFPDPNRTIVSYDREYGSGQSTIEAFLAEAASQEKGRWLSQYTASALVEYFQKGFGIWPGKRANPGRILFTGKGGDRVRWDNPRNWSTSDLPIHNDTVCIEGHEVYYSGTNDLRMLDLGNGGVLRIHQGRLRLTDPDSLTAGPQGGSVYLDRSGHLVMEGITEHRPIKLFLRNGWFENRADVSADMKIQIEAAGGKAYLVGRGKTLHFGSGSMLKVVGDSVQAGYFGNGCVSFEGSGVLRFTCGEDGVSRLGEVVGESIDSVLSVGSSQAVLEIDVSRLQLPPGEHQLILVKVDRLRGRFARERITGTYNGAVAEAKIEYDLEAGEIRLRCTCLAPRTDL